MLGKEKYFNKWDLCEALRMTRCIAPLRRKYTQSIVGPECGTENHPACVYFERLYAKKGTLASKQTQNTSQSLQGYKGDFYLSTY